MKRATIGMIGPMGLLLLTLTAVAKASHGGDTSGAVPRPTSRQMTKLKKLGPHVHSVSAVLGAVVAAISRWAASRLGSPANGSSALPRKRGLTDPPCLSG